MNMLAKLLTLSLVLVTLSACGNNKRLIQGSSTTSSTETPHDNTTTYVASPGDGVLADCNSFSRGDLGLTGALTSFYNPQTNSYIIDFIRLALTQVPDNIKSDSNHYLQFFRWSIQGANTRTVNPTAAPIYFQFKRTGAYLNSGSPETRISKNVIDSLISRNNLLQYNINPNNFFDNVIIVLDGMDLVYNGISFALYNSASGTSATASFDVLIPAFLANPNAYAVQHSSATLHQLHPNWSVRTSGLSDGGYRDRANGLCSGIL